MESGMWLVGCAYHVCWVHESLRMRAIGGRKWLERTPAMAAGLTDYVWTLEEVLRSPVPPRADAYLETTARPSPRSWLSPPLPGTPRAPTDGGGPHDHTSMWQYLPSR